MKKEVHLILHSFLSLQFFWYTAHLLAHLFISGSGYSETEKGSHQLFDFLE